MDQITLMPRVVQNLVGALKVRCRHDACGELLLFEHLALHERSQCSHRNEDAVKKEEAEEAATMVEMNDSLKRAERHHEMLNDEGGDERDSGPEDGAEMYAYGARQIHEATLAAELVAQGVSIVDVAEILNMTEADAGRLAASGCREETDDEGRLVERHLERLVSLEEDLELFGDHISEQLRAAGDSSADDY